MRRHFQRRHDSGGVEISELVLASDSPVVSRKFLFIYIKVVHANHTPKEREREKIVTERVPATKPKREREQVCFDYFSLSLSVFDFKGKRGQGCRQGIY